MFSAREFVQWYNGHPDNASLPIDLSTTTSVAICGLGNVAVDCARVLLRDPDQLAVTDIAAHALAQLRTSAVREVHLIGRRGPANAAFTAKELRELLNLPNVAVQIDGSHFEETLSEAERAALTSRARKRVFDILGSAASDNQTQLDGDRVLHLHFFRNPVAIEAHAATPDACGAVVVEATRMAAGADGQLEGTGVMHTLPAQLVLESIGYKSLPLEGAPFDARRGVIPNVYAARASIIETRVTMFNGQHCGSTGRDGCWLQGVSWSLGCMCVDGQSEVHQASSVRCHSWWLTHTHRRAQAPT